MHHYGHAGMLHRLTRCHTDQSEGSKLTWTILVWVSPINYHTYRCPQTYFYCLFEHILFQVQICPLSKPLCWLVCCSSWRSSQEFLGNSGCGAETRIRPERPNSPSPTSTISQRWPANLGSHIRTVLYEICSISKCCLLTYSAFYHSCSFCLLLWNKLTNK